MREDSRHATSCLDDNGEVTRFCVRAGRVTALVGVEDLRQPFQCDLVSLDGSGPVISRVLDVLMRDAGFAKVMTEQPVGPSAGCSHREPRRRERCPTAFGDCRDGRAR